MSMGLTDEIFAVTAMYPKKASIKHGVYFYGAIFLTAFFSWVIGF
ncbi:hypothetical protein A21D_02643 [Virgibacillus dokdonensis]|nr:hypothetical protein A21D_02643 [Virgibacillus dokdonensis]